jgi:hypothetical protein
MQGIEVTRQLAREHQASLRRSRLVPDESRSFRRWLGHQLVRAGTWLANERRLELAPAR